MTSGWQWGYCKNASHRATQCQHRGLEYCEAYCFLISLSFHRTKYHPEVLMKPDTSLHTRIAVPSPLFTLTRWLCQSCTQALPPLLQIHPVIDRRKAFSSSNRTLCASSSRFPLSKVQLPVDTGEVEPFSPSVSPAEGVCECFGQVAAGRSSRELEAIFRW